MSYVQRSLRSVSNQTEALLLDCEAGKNQTSAKIRFGRDADDGHVRPQAKGGSFDAERPGRAKLWGRRPRGTGHGRAGRPVTSRGRSPGTGLPRGSERGAGGEIGRSFRLPLSDFDRAPRGVSRPGTAAVLRTGKFSIATAVGVDRTAEDEKSAETPAARTTPSNRGQSSGRG
ncbi:hypothetical protein THAOC_27908 [Thalassiosira oceanica]|uniref:Uncharacterized protein n=1 Tax=Thalassiosira oceanica TaxID=159749 RepID=K0RHS1_THAOC|nr:hypothetical protein THAOC_27908 [Thalassiosira oceanica]|eukprot:EJK52785.1 hypothetical protein THAOC_27908 [Thalassiosira oceanica]